jgi:hypothetical protein
MAGKGNLRVESAWPSRLLNSCSIASMPLTECGHEAGEGYPPLQGLRERHSPTSLSMRQRPIRMVIHGRRERAWRTA